MKMTELPEKMLADDIRVSLDLRSGLTRYKLHTSSARTATRKVMPMLLTISRRAIFLHGKWQGKCRKEVHNYLKKTNQGRSEMHLSLCHEF
jgi:hypothetical protein